jgi:DNA sulfur modification protein DndD
LTAQIDDLERGNTSLENDIFSIKNDLKGVDLKTSSKTRQEYDVRNRELGQYETEMDRFDENIQEFEEQIKDIKRKPDFGLDFNENKIFKKTEVTEKLHEIFEDSISEYRSRMRKKIEKRATETFSELTTEKKFDKLIINDGYGLDLLVDGHKIRRSAGAEQIVAISLIESLNHLGRRKGPMFMDTPAGRLDTSHRANIMNHLPTVVTQLALFAHSGELDEEDIYFDRSLIGKMYRLERKSTFNSQIVEV